MVEIEKVLDLLAIGPVTPKQIAEKLNCTPSAVKDALIFLTVRGEPKMYISVVDKGSSFAYTINKPHGGTELE